MASSPSSAAARATTLLLALAAILVPLALVLVWFYAPVESRMGVAQRIFYFHVPAAWALYAATALCAGASAVFLANRSERADALAAAAGAVALFFAVVVLVTGPLWARAAWKTFWVWEARLTGVLVLTLALAAYALLRRAALRAPGLSRFAAVLAVLAVLNVPIIHVAVRKWRGRHPTVLGSGGGGIEPEMAVALGVALAAFTALFALLVLFRYRLERARRELARLALERALGGADHPEESPR